MRLPCTLGHRSTPHSAMHLRARYLGPLLAWKHCLCEFSICLSCTTEVWIFHPCMAQAGLIHHGGLALSSMPCRLLCRFILLADSLGQWGSFSGPPYMEKQPFVLQLLLGVSLLAHAEPRPLLSVSGREAPPLAVRACTVVVPSRPPRQHRNAHPAGPGFPPCFWHLGVSLSSQLGGVCQVFLNLSSALCVCSGVEHLLEGMELFTQLSFHKKPSYLP